eukprot:gene24588-29905_t
MGEEKEARISTPAVLDGALEQELKANVRLALEAPVPLSDDVEFPVSPAVLHGRGAGRREEAEAQQVAFEDEELSEERKRELEEALPQKSADAYEQYLDRKREMNRKMQHLDRAQEQARTLGGLGAAAAQREIDRFTHQLVDEFHEAKKKRSETGGQIDDALLGHKPATNRRRIMVLKIKCFAQFVRMYEAHQDVHTTEKLCRVLGVSVTSLQLCIPLDVLRERVAHKKQVGSKSRGVKEGSMLDNMKKGSLMRKATKKSQESSSRPSSADIASLGLLHAAATPESLQAAQVGHDKVCVERMLGTALVLAFLELNRMVSAEQLELQFLRMYPLRRSADGAGGAWTWSVFEEENMPELLQSSKAQARETRKTRKAAKDSLLGNSLLNPAKKLQMRKVLKFMDNSSSGKTLTPAQQEELKYLMFQRWRDALDEQSSSEDEPSENERHATDREMRAPNVTGADSDEDEEREVALRPMSRTGMTPSPGPPVSMAGPVAESRVGSEDDLAQWMSRFRGRQAGPVAEGTDDDDVALAAHLNKSLRDQHAQLSTLREESLVSSLVEGATGLFTAQRAPAERRPPAPSHVKPAGAGWGDRSGPSSSGPHAGGSKKKGVQKSKAGGKEMRPESRARLPVAAVATLPAPPPAAAALTPDSRLMQDGMKVGADCAAMEASERDDAEKVKWFRGFIPAPLTQEEMEDRDMEKLNKMMKKLRADEGKSTMVLARGCHDEEGEGAFGMSDSEEEAEAPLELPPSDTSSS